MPRKAKPIIDIRSLARVHTSMAVRTLVGIAKQPKTPPAARVAAATALLDRGWGKPSQPLTGKDEEPLGVEVEMLTPVEREQRIAAVLAKLAATQSGGQ